MSSDSIGVAAHDRSAQLPAGLWPVMITPFLDDGAIDWQGVDAVTDWYIASGAAGLFACCLSSEMYHLDEAERIALVQRVLRRVDGRIPVVATGNFGGEISAQARSLRRVYDLGVAAAVILPNQLVREDEPDGALRDRLERLLNETGDAVLGLYEIPAPYKRIISAEIIGWAAHTGRFTYLKDTTCEPAAIRAKLAAAQGTRLRLYNAWTGGALESLNDGAAGLSPIAANCYPELFTWLCANHRTQPEKARRLQRLMRVLEPAVCEQYVASAKRVMGLRGVPIGTRCRNRTLTIDAELIALHESLIEVIEEALSEYGIEGGSASSR
ncbi:MAG: dihydrodipicolinate synthase family protein [Chloroflexi bacterium]|nr:dihydrodipicolinate synthase family protein [Chloroflexota bacterium]